MLSISEQQKLQKAKQKNAASYAEWEKSLSPLRQTGEIPSLPPTIIQPLQQPKPSKSILSESQQEILNGMTYELETDVLYEIVRLTQQNQSISPENLPLSILLRVALENIAEKHVIDNSYKATYDYFKRL